MGVRLHPAAGKHGIEFEDVLSAMTVNLRKRVPDFDEPRSPGLARPTLFIGLSRGGQLLEVLAVITPPVDVFVFHAMPLRPETAKRARFYEEE